ncbi:hypothetical protein [Bufonid herpesvirus 1]|uniref:hypothetical protein n=1 Tax=Bufonid herpesvirus 1 TaxID=2282206 RepID=UPI000EB78078|nr:hypothetical protein [Bufonid herpesvirus 1]AXF48593.1 hypothetical protein [Bufonid herpesvirus 1]
MSLGDTFNLSATKAAFETGSVKSVDTRKISSTDISLTPRLFTVIGNSQYCNILSHMLLIKIFVGITDAVLLSLFEEYSIDRFDLYMLTPNIFVDQNAFHV